MSQNLKFFVIFTEFQLVPVQISKLEAHCVSVRKKKINSTLLTVGCETVMERPAR